jgi:hypothetical protein
MLNLQNQAQAVIHSHAIFARIQQFNVSTKKSKHFTVAFPRGGEGFQQKVIKYKQLLCHLL